MYTPLNMSWACYKEEGSPDSFNDISYVNLEQTEFCKRSEAQKEDHYLIIFMRKV